MKYLDNLIAELESYCIRSPLTVDDDTITVDDDTITVDNDIITVDSEIL